MEGITMNEILSANQHPRLGGNSVRATFVAGGMIVICLIGLTTTLQAKEEPIDFELPSYQVEALKLDIQLPVPVKSVVPRLRPNLAGTEVVMSFSVDENGKTYAINDNARAFDDRQKQLASAMGLLLRSWRFEPAQDKNGKAVAVRMAMPIKVVLNGESSKQGYARLKVAKPTLTAVAKL